MMPYLRQRANCLMRRYYLLTPPPRQIYDTWRPKMTGDILSLDEMQQTYEFSLLTQRQKLWISTYIASGFNRVLATRTCYKCKNDTIAKIMSYTVMRHPKMIVAIARASGKSEKEAFLEYFRNALQHGKLLTREQVEAAKLYCRCMGWTLNPETENAKTTDATPRKAGRPRTVPVKPPPPPSFDLSEFEKK